MLKKLAYLAIGLLLVVIGWFAGHVTSPDSYTSRKLGQSQYLFESAVSQLQKMCPIFLSDQAKLEQRLRPGETLETYSCDTQQYTAPSSSLQ